MSDQSYRRYVNEKCYRNLYHAQSKQPLRKANKIFKSMQDKNCFTKMSDQIYAKEKKLLSNAIGMKICDKSMKKKYIQKI